jgi:hypothetical protein
VGRTYCHAHPARFHSNCILERLRRIPLYWAYSWKPTCWHKLDVSQCMFLEVSYSAFTNRIISSGFDHQAWLDMTDYFIKWYKTGSPPAITEDKVYYNYRPHAAAAVASECLFLSGKQKSRCWLNSVEIAPTIAADPFGPPANATVSKDAVYAAVFLTSDSTAQQLRITIGAASRTFDHLKPGSISTFSAPWSGNGGDVRVELLDGFGKSLLSGTGQRSISNSIQAYNFSSVHFSFRTVGSIQILTLKWNL